MTVALPRLKMKPDQQLCGYERRSQVPGNSGMAKICRRCQLWFLPRPYEQVCDNCCTKAQLVKRLGSSLGGGPKSRINPQVSRVAKVASGITIERGPSLYSYYDRKRSVKLALKLAQNAALTPDLEFYVDNLLTYAVSTSKRVVPGSAWQFVMLGHSIAPCNGDKAPNLLPRTDGVETEAVETL